MSDAGANGAAAAAEAIMNCERAQQLLLDGPDGPGDRQEWARAVRHADACQACSAASAAFDRIADALRATGATPAVEPAGGFDAFADRLLQTVHGAVRCQGGSGRRLFAIPVRWGLAAAACVALAGAAGYVAGRSRGAAAPDLLATSHPSHVATRPAFVASPPTPREIAGAAATFAQVSEVFGPRTNWVLLGEGDAEMGVTMDASDVAPQAGAARPITRLLFLRLTVLQNEAVVSNADLVIVPGRSAELALPMQGGQQLRYKIGTSRELPAKLSVLLEHVTPQGKRPLAALGTELRLLPGEDVSAGRLNTSAGPYELRLAFADAPLGGATAPDGGKGRP